MTVSTHTRTALQRVDDPFGTLNLLEISGPGLGGVVRLVADTSNAVHAGNTYVGVPFEVTLPKQADKETPRVSLRMDNVGREIVQDLEALQPGAELLATVKVVHRATPDVVDFSFSAPLSAVSVDVLSVTAAFGVDDVWRAPAVAPRFDPASAPGLFPT